MSILAEPSRVEEGSAVVGHQEWLSGRSTEQLLKRLKSPGELLVLLQNGLVATFQVLDVFGGLC